MKKLSPAFWLPLLTIAVLFLTVGYPLVVLFLQSLFPELLGGSLEGFLSAYAKIFTTPGLGSMLWTSLLWGLATTGGAWLLGAPCGWILARTDFPGKALVRILLLVPVMSPAYINALAYVMTMQEGGFADALLGGIGGVPEALRGVFFGFWGVTFVMVMSSFGAVGLAVEASLRSLPGRLEDAAASLGANGWQILRLVLLPLLLPAFLNTGILVFLDAISNFGVPAIMGPRSNLPLLPAEIYQLVTSWPLDFPLATALAAVLCLGALAMISLGRRLLATHPMGRSRPVPVAERPLGPVMRILAWTYFGVLFFLSAVLPNAVVILTSFVARWNAGNPVFTIAHYEGLFLPGSGAFQAVTTSLTLSLATATAAVIVGGIGGYALARYPGMLGRIADVLSLLPRMVPRIVTAVAFILAWNAPWVLLEIYNTVWILFLAYFALYQSDAFRLADAGMRTIGVNLEHAAEILGASHRQILRKIVLPLLAPSLFVAWVTTFVVCMRDWVASIILLPPGVQTIGSFIFSQFDQGDVSAAMAMATCTVVVSTFVLVAVQSRKRKS